MNSLSLSLRWKNIKQGHCTPGSSDDSAGEEVLSTWVSGLAINEAFPGTFRRTLPSNCGRKEPLTF